MWGCIGFSAAALIFAAYSMSCSERMKTPGLNLEYFRSAYETLAAACLAWAVGALLGGEGLKAAIVVGNVLALAATILMVLSWVRSNRLIWLAGLSAVALAAMAARLWVYPPEAYMHHGVLIFNEKTPVFVAFTLLFSAVWLPLSLHAAHSLTRLRRLAPYRATVSFSFIIATLSTVLLLAARRPVTVVIAFVTLCLCFVSLITINRLAWQGDSHGE